MPYLFLKLRKGHFEGILFRDLVSPPPAFFSFFHYWYLVYVPQRQEVTHTESAEMMAGGPGSAQEPGSGGGAGLGVLATR